MADVFPKSSTTGYELLKREFSEQVDVPDDRKFIGFDAYQRAMDCLRPGDVAIFATPPAFRWVHFTYAIEKGLNVFMEKPVTVDGPDLEADVRPGRSVAQEEPQGRRGPDVPPLQGTRGNCSTASRWARSATSRMLRAYRMHGPVASAFANAQARGRQRADVADLAVPQLPVGQRRLLQRLLDPQSSTSAAG